MNRLIETLLRGLHMHHDPDWQVDVVWEYHQCPCGAKRVRRRYGNLYGPVRKEWSHLLTDSHGQRLSDSGWRR